MSIQDRKNTGPCQRCGRPIYASGSIERRLCGMCHRELRAGGMKPKVLGYLLSRELSLEWEARP